MYVILSGTVEVLTGRSRNIYELENLKEAEENLHKSHDHN